MKGLEQIQADEAALARSKRERCKHENVDHLFPGQGWALMSGAEMPDALVEQLRCNDCAAWLSLGPAADDSPQVAIETTE